MVIAFLGLNSFTLIELQIIIARVALLVSPCDPQPRVVALVREDLVNVLNSTTSLNNNLVVYEVDPQTGAQASVVYIAPIDPQRTTMLAPGAFPIASGTPPNTTSTNYYFISFAFPDEVKSRLQEGKYYDVRFQNESVPITLLSTQLSTPPYTVANPLSSYYFPFSFQYLDCSKTFAECNACDDTEPQCNPTVNLFNNFDNGTFESITPANGGFQQSLGSFEKKNDASFFIPDANYLATGRFRKVQHSFPLSTPLTVAAGTSVNVSAWIKIDPSAYMGEAGGNTTESLRSYDIGILRPADLAIEQGWTIDGTQNFKKWQPFQVKLSNLGSTAVTLSQLVFTSSAQVSLSFAEDMPLTPQGAWATDFFLDDITVTCTEVPFVQHALNLNADFKAIASTRTTPKRNQFIAGHTEYVDLGVHADYLSAFPYYCQPLVDPELDLKDDDCGQVSMGPSLVCEKFVIEFDLKVNGYSSDFPTTFNNSQYLEPVLSRLSADGKGWKFSVIKTDRIGFPNAGELDLEFSWTFDEDYGFETEGSFSSCIDRTTDKFVIRSDLAGIDLTNEAKWVRVTLQIEPLDAEYSGTQNDAVKGKNRVSLTIKFLENGGVAQTLPRILPDDIAKDVISGNSTVSRELCDNNPNSGQWPPHCCRSSNCNIQLTEVGQYPLILGNNNPQEGGSPNFSIKNLSMTKGEQVVLDMPFNQANGASALDYSAVGTSGKLINYNTNRSIGGGAWQKLD